jgi:hypothetical protein
MKKEVALAVSLGFILGLIITFGIWTANKSLKNHAQEKTATPTTARVQADISPTPVPADGFSLSITSPEDEALSNVSNIVLTGVTSPKAVLAIMSETGQQIVEADTDGEFTAKITLEGGYNNLSVTAFDSSGNSASKNIVVTYTTSKI